MYLIKGLFLRRRSGRQAAALIAAALLTGCAPAALREVSREVTPGITVMQVAADPAPFIGKKVLWGGIIVSSENMAKETKLDIVEVPLTSIRRPGNPDLSRGRFIVEHEGFLDTSIYARGREITLAGEIIGTRKGKIGEMEYAFPVLKGIKLHLWQAREDEYYSSEFFFYHPFYYPYYYNPYPGRRRPLHVEPPYVEPPYKDPPRRDPPPGHDDDNGKGKRNNRGGWR
ncbi:MAG: Slp family lipoprotein [bacterium]|nr:Slp family lipoprotein [bacterium]